MSTYLPQPPLFRQNENTVIALSSHQLQLGRTPLQPTQADGIRYKIRIARRPQHFEEAAQLVEKMYGSRGYQVQTEAEPERLVPELCMLVYDEDGAAVGTVTAGFGDPILLRADELYSTELSVMRQAGYRPMEMTRFAIDGHGMQSARILAAVINVAYVCGKLAGFNRLVIELNPRHVPFYEKHFGFVRAGALRTCPRVNAPAILLALDFSYIAAEVARMAGSDGRLPEARKNLFRHFLDESAEKVLTERLVSSGSFNQLH